MKAENWREKDQIAFSLSSKTRSLKCHSMMKLLFIISSAQDHIPFFAVPCPYYPLTIKLLLPYHKRIFNIYYCRYSADASQMNRRWYDDGIVLVSLNQGDDVNGDSGQSLHFAFKFFLFPVFYSMIWEHRYKLSL